MSADTALLTAAGGSSVASAVGHLREGEEQAQTLRQNAALKEEDAKLAIAQSKFTARQERIQGEEIIGRAVAITGASGVKVGRMARGSVVTTRAADQGRIETSISNILFSGKIAAHRYRLIAANLEQQAKAARRAGRVRAVTSILQGASSMASIKSNANVMAMLKKTDTGAGTGTLGVPLPSLEGDL